MWARPAGWTQVRAPGFPKGERVEGRNIAGLYPDFASREPQAMRTLIFLLASLLVAPSAFAGGGSTPPVGPRKVFVEVSGLT